PPPLPCTTLFRSVLEDRGEPVEELPRVVAAGLGHTREGRVVLAQEPRGLADADLLRHPCEFPQLDLACDAEDERKLDAPRPHPGRPRGDRRRVEAQVRYEVRGVVA